MYCSCLGMVGWDREGVWYIIYQGMIMGGVYKKYLKKYVLLFLKYQFLFSNFIWFNVSLFKVRYFYYEIFFVINKIFFVFKFFVVILCNMIQVWYQYIVCLFLEGCWVVYFVYKRIKLDFVIFFGNDYD